MSNPLVKQKAQSVAQDALRSMVEREVTPVIQEQLGPKSPVEDAFVRAIYNPDRRLG